MIDINNLDDTQKNALVNNRWTSSETIWDKVDQTYKQNTAIYENRSNWLQYLPERRRRFQVQANRIFVNMEAVINSLIAQPPGINILPSRDGTEAQDFARKLEHFFRKKYADLNTKETMRMGLRNLYFGRLIVIKPFWNTKRNDFDFRAIDPRKVRFGKYSRKEIDSEFAIEEIEDNLCAVIDRFPKKKKELMEKYGILTDDDLYIKNPDVKYKEAWIVDHVIFKLDNIILDTIKNPYWDWEGILITDDEETQLASANTEQRREIMLRAKLEQPQREAEQVQQTQLGPYSVQQQSGQQAVQNQQPAIYQAGEQPPVPEGQQPLQTDQDGNSLPSVEPTPPKYKQYMYNYFDTPRKPYIFATILNNENSPIGRTDMITLSAELQRGIDKRKMDIDENCELANGVLKVDASVMGKADAQRIRFETKGIIWGKGVKDGVTRETGQALPDMVFEDMKDSRSEIDNIMAANSAFKGQREGEETKGGRLALIQQSYLQLNELIQVVDFVSKEIFNWGMQLSKTRYTEYHYAKWMGKSDAQETIEIIQDDFETGSEIVVTPGKTLPVDEEFKFQQAQSDVKEGYISPPDYLEIANYDNAKELSKNAFLYKVSPFSQFDITDEERAKIPPPLPQSNMRETISFDNLPANAKVQWLQRMGINISEDEIKQEGELSPVSIAFKDLSPDLQAQVATQQGWTPNPQILVAEKLQQNQKDKDAAQAQQLQQLAGAHAQIQQSEQPTPTQ